MTLDYDKASKILTPVNGEYTFKVKSGHGFPFHYQVTVIVNIVPGA
jgi:hypothetical protein